MYLYVCMCKTELIREEEAIIIRERVTEKVGGKEFARAGDRKEKG